MADDSESDEERSHLPNSRRTNTGGASGANGIAGVSGSKMDRILAKQLGTSSGSRSGSGGAGRSGGSGSSDKQQFGIFRTVASWFKRLLW